MILKLKDVPELMVAKEFESPYDHLEMCQTCCGCIIEGKNIGIEEQSSRSLSIEIDREKLANLLMNEYDDENNWEDISFEGQRKHPYWLMKADEIISANLITVKAVMEGK